MAHVQVGSMQACPFADGSQGGRSPRVSGKNLEDEDLSNELCPGTWLGVPLAKLPANTPAAMCHGGEWHSVGTGQAHGAQ